MAFAALVNGSEGALSPGELVNISVRTRTGFGDGALIAGFVVNGEGQRPLLVRAVGPTLAAKFGVPGVLPDPQVALFRNNDLFRENFRWNDAPEILAESNRLGAFELVLGSKDAALIAAVTEGVYTAIARSATGVTGDLLLEVYDARASEAVAPAISNLSLRAELGTGSTMVVGFVVSGGAPKRLLIRAVGPTLAKFGVEDALRNPQVRLFTESVDVALNDDWGAASNAEAIAGISQTLGAFGLDRDSKDSAVLTSLQPGAYTLHVTSAVPNDHGIVLVEVYSADPVLADPPSTPAAAPAPGLPDITVYSPDDTADESGETGEIRFHRTGETSAPLAIRLAWTGSATAGIDYLALPAEITFPADSSEVGLIVTPLADAFAESPEAAVVTVQPGETYNLSAHVSAGVLIKDAPFATIGWHGQYFNNSTHSGTPVLVRTDAAIDFDWEASPGPGVRSDNFSVRWTGVFIPPSTGNYSFIVNGDDFIRLSIDGAVVYDRPKYHWLETAITLPLAGGVPHVIQFDLVDTWGRAEAHLEVAGGGRARHVLGETAPVTTAAPTPTGLDRTVVMVGEPIVAQLTSAGAVDRYAVAGLPPGLALNPQSGVISGTATVVGDYAIWVDATGSAGTGSARLLLRVVAPGGRATRELYPARTGSTGLSLALDETPVSSDAVTTLDLTGAGGPDLERIHGYITAPETGLYRFWLSAGGPARFHFAASDEPGDKVLRAQVATGGSPRSWTAESGQQSPWLELKAGGRHYFEILRARSGGTNHVSLGWIRPGQSGSVPFEIVPGYVLSPFDGGARLDNGSAVYLATLRPIGAVPSGGFAVGSIVLAPDEGSASVSLRFGGLTSAPTNIQIYHGDASAGMNLPVRGLPRGSFEGLPWSLSPVGGLTRAELVQAMKSGRLFVAIQTANHPTGELRAQFAPALGSVAFSPPPVPAAPVSDALDARGAARFLNQGTFGATLPEIERLQQTGMNAWFAEQLAAPTTRFMPYVRALREAVKQADPTADIYTQANTEAWWQAAVLGPDQLRQRMAFALSEIHVVSAESNLEGNTDALGLYYDLLIDHALGNFRDLLRAITLSPAMGVYLSMVRNQKPDPAAGIFPDENFAREVMQLFSIGLNKLHPDGTLVLDSHGLPLATYGQETITGFARIFTGWSFWSDDPNYSFSWGQADFEHPMMFYADYHDEESKRVLDGEVIPGGRSGPEEIEHVIDMLFRHQNTGPFICRQLIQRLVTSNPSPGYVHRVANTFADNGAGVRGDLAAVARAILTDHEARSVEVANLQGYGKLREPLIRVAHLWRALNASTASGYFDYAWTVNHIGQEILRSPTVFNFFQPDYITPGPAAEAGLVAPEFQIATDGHLAHFVNTLDWFVWRSAEWVDQPVIEIELESSLVGTPDALLDRLDLLLLSGSMTPGLRSRLRTLLTDLPPWYTAGGRVRSVVFSLITSPDYAVQK